MMQPAPSITIFQHNTDWSHIPYPDISSRAKWSVSSYKFGFGAECLRDDDTDTFWHSDGPQPHYITVEFPSKVAIQQIAVELSFQQDDSYTPSEIEIRAGTGVNDLQRILYQHFEKPDGWILLDVNTEPREDGEPPKPLYAYALQIVIQANHLSGKDTHVRGLKILGPRDELSTNGDPFPFVDPQYTLYERLR